MVLLDMNVAINLATRIIVKPRLLWANLPFTSTTNYNFSRRIATLLIENQLEIYEPPKEG